MLRSAFLASVFFATSAAYGDAVTDVRLLAGQEQIWIALDAQPEALQFQLRGDGVYLELTGFEVGRPRSILPNGSDAISSLEVMPAEASTRVLISGRFAQAYAELRQGGVLIDLSAEAASRMSDQRQHTSRLAAGMSLQAQAPEQARPGPNRTEREASGPGAATGRAAVPEDLERRDTLWDATRPVEERLAAEARAASMQAEQAGLGPEGAGDRPVASAQGNQGSVRQGFQIADPYEEPRSESGGMWLMRGDGEGADETPAGSAPAVQPEQENDDANAPVAAPDEQPALDPDTIDVSTIPGETELVTSNAELPGPCDPTAAAIASSPWDLDALADHAGCLIGIGEFENGAGLYERVLAFDPGHFPAALGLARLRERQGRREDAARLFETAANAALTDGQALSARAAARRLRQDDDS
ncbi:hypothetical protein NHF40_07855 [Maricaulaceae bacterium EIL42A08]|nr:hypothetical protein [Maricaulaceae bacterium EIL42A08]